MHFLPANAQHIGDRHSQQDSFGFGDPEDRAFTAHGGFLALVCDGMGGMEFGDAASRTATRAFLDTYKTKTPAESIPTALERSVRAANDAVLELAHNYGLTEGMGTTLVAAALLDASLYFVSVGDSGLFLRRNGSLRMLNHPHVFANLLDAAVARGNLAREDAENHPERESLTSFIGAEALDEIDLSAEPLPLADGDAIVLASDGLFKTLSLEEMTACLNGDALAWPDKLVASTIAKKREHQDNVTVLSIAVEGEGAAAPIVESAPTEAAPAASAQPPASPQPESVMPVAAAVPARKSKSIVPWVVFIVLALVASAAAWWFFANRKVGRFTSAPVPGSTVKAPARAQPAEIKLDPDAPHVAPAAPASGKETGR